MAATNNTQNLRASTPPISWPWANGQFVLSTGFLEECLQCLVSACPADLVIYQQDKGMCNRLVYQKENRNKPYLNLVNNKTYIIFEMWHQIEKAHPTAFTSTCITITSSGWLLDSHPRCRSTTIAPIWIWIFHHLMQLVWVLHCLCAI